MHLYARERGVDFATVRNAARRGLLSLVNGRINREIADREWIANKLPAGGSEKALRAVMRAYRAGWRPDPVDPKLSKQRYWKTLKGKDIAAAQKARRLAAAAKRRAEREALRATPEWQSQRREQISEIKRLARARAVARRRADPARQASERQRRRRYDARPERRVVQRLRRWIQKHLRQHWHTSRGWSKRLGYGPEELRAHIEARFLQDMSWENISDWHVDHIRPVASFKFTGPDDPAICACFGLENLQPLWARDNLVKGARNP